MELYRGPKQLIAPSTKGVSYLFKASWVIHRSENDIWYNHMAFPTVGVKFDDVIWSKRIAQISNRPPNFGLHLAIFVEPYLQYIFEGKKTVESRFGVAFPRLGMSAKGMSFF